MNILLIIEGVALTFIWLFICWILGFITSEMYSMLHKKIRWAKEDEEWQKFLKDKVVIAKKEYDELKKVN